VKRVIILLLISFELAVAIAAFLSESHNYVIKVGPFKLGEIQFDFHPSSIARKSLRFEARMTFSGIARWLIDNHYYLAKGNLVRPDDIIDTFDISEISNAGPIKEVSIVASGGQVEYCYYSNGQLLKCRLLTCAEQNDLSSLGHFIQTLERGKFSVGDTVVYGEGGLKFWRLEVVKQESMAFYGRKLKSWVLRPKFQDENTPLLKNISDMVNIKIGSIIQIFNLNNQALLWLAEDGSIPKIVIGAVTLNRVIKN